MFLDYLYFNLKKQLFGDSLIKSSLAGGCVVLDGEGSLAAGLLSHHGVVRGFSHLTSIAVA